MTTCPTIKVVSPSAPGGFVVINESDRTDGHQLWRGDEPVGPKREGGGQDRVQPDLIGQDKPHQDKPHQDKADGGAPVIDPTEKPPAANPNLPPNPGAPGRNIRRGG